MIRTTAALYSESYCTRLALSSSLRICGYRSDFTRAVILLVCPTILSSPRVTKLLRSWKMRQRCHYRHSTAQFASSFGLSGLFSALFVAFACHCARHSGYCLLATNTEHLKSVWQGYRSCSTSSLQHDIHSLFPLIRGRTSSAVPSRQSAAVRFPPDSTRLLIVPWLWQQQLLSRHSQQ